MLIIPGQCTFPFAVFAQPMFAKIMLSVVGFYILHEWQSCGLKRFDGRSYTERLSQGSVRAAENIQPWDLPVNRT